MPPLNFGPPSCNIRATKTPHINRFPFEEIWQFPPNLSLIPRWNPFFTQLIDVQVRVHVREVTIVNLVYFPLTKHPEYASF